MVRVHAFKLAALALACAVLILGSQHTLAAVLKGSAMYRERIALPPTAVFEVTLEDSSRANRPADVLGRARLEPAGQPPFRFEISYDPAQIAPGGRYVLRAQITDRGKLLFVTDRQQPIALNAPATDVTLTLRAAPRPPQSALGPLPASFAGKLPCADCPGVKWHLDLLVDGTYLLRIAYHDRRPEAGWDEIGRWTVSGQPAVLRLSGTGDDTQAFEVRGPNRLRKLDIEGSPIDSRLDYELKRLPAFAPFEASLRLAGMYTQQDTDGFITLCATGRRLPVAAEADNAALDAAYRALPPGTPLLADLEGRIVYRAAKTGGPPQPTVVVDHFISLQPERTCEPRQPQMGLQGTYWKLTELHGTAVSNAPGRQQAHLLLAPDKRLAGSGGCNRLLGGYQLEGTKLTFGRIAGTMILETSVGRARGCRLQAGWQGTRRTQDRPLLRRATPPDGLQVAQLGA